MATICNLSNELLYQICDYLLLDQSFDQNGEPGHGWIFCPHDDYTDLLNVSMTCKRLNAIARGLRVPYVLDLNHPDEETRDRIAQELSATIHGFLGLHIADVERQKETRRKLRMLPLAEKMPFFLEESKKRSQITHKKSNYVHVTLPTSTTRVSAIAHSAPKEVDKIIRATDFKIILGLEHEHAHTHDAAPSTPRLCSLGLLRLMLHIHPNLKNLHLNIPEHPLSQSIGDSGILMLLRSASRLESLKSLSLSGKNFPLSLPTIPHSNISPLRTILEIPNLRSLRLAHFDALTYGEDEPSAGMSGILNRREKYPSIHGSSQHELQHVELHDCKMPCRVLGDLLHSFAGLSAFVWNTSGPKSIPEKFLFRRQLFLTHPDFETPENDPGLLMHITPECDAEAEYEYDLKQNEIAQAVRDRNHKIYLRMMGWRARRFEAQE